MNKKDRKLLKETLIHWKNNRELAEKSKYFNIGIDSEDCAFCREYAKNCKKCPIYKHTKKEGCFGTSFYIIRDLIDIIIENRNIICTESLELLQKMLLIHIDEEIKLLKSLEK